MTAIIVTLVVAVVCLCLTLVLFLDAAKSDAEHEGEALPPSLGLKAMCIPHSEVLFDRSDYDKLREVPELRVISGRFRRERRQIILDWLRDLRHDVLVLSRFCRFLVRNGCPVTLREEVAVGLELLMGLVQLSCTRTSVFLFGPFWPQASLRKARVPAERLSTRSALLLSRLPSHTREEVTERWTRQILMPDVG